MSKIILQPAGNKDARKHYTDTVQKSVPLTLIKPHVSSEEFEVLNDIYPTGECKLWGVTPGGNNPTKWNRIASGDVTLFSKEGLIYASAVTTFKLHSHSLAAKLWGYDNKGQTWENIFFLEEIRSHSIPYLAFNRAVGYADNNVIQGFDVLRPHQSAAMLNTFDLQSEIFVEDISEETYNDIISKLEALEETESEIISKRRLEQGYLKKILFGKKTIGTCAGCKKDFPVSYLVTAHIKKRAFCEHNERKDLNIVMSMCKMGCDEIYENGYISVSNGIFTDMKKLPTSPHLQHYITQISDKKCEQYNEKTKVYFDWHFEHHKKTTDNR